MVQNNASSDILFCYNEQSDRCKNNLRELIGWSDVTVICGNITISMLRGNTAYCVNLSSEDSSHNSNKIESAGLRKCPYYHYLTKKVMPQ